MSTDEVTILELHAQFIEANKHEDVAWLEAHTTSAVSWFNLNKSNYYSQQDILALWRTLYEQRPEKTKDATLTVSARLAGITGDVAWVAYNLSVDYDFGEFAQFHAGARATEIWQRFDDGWKLCHFHCSEHEAGNMGGR